MLLFLDLVSNPAAPPPPSIQTSTRLRFRFDEHGPMRAFAVSGAGGSTLFPLAKVEVFYAPDWVGLARGAGGPRRVEGFLGYAVLSSGQTDPVDEDRQIQVTRAAARYGDRSNAGPDLAGPTTDTIYEWVPLDPAGTPTGARVRDLVWDAQVTRPRPFGAIEVALPRKALGLELMDTFDLESFAFPWGPPRYLPGQANWMLNVSLGDGFGPMHQVREGRFSVRAIRATAASGAAWPVLVTAILERWL